MLRRILATLALTAVIITGATACGSDKPKQNPTTNPTTAAPAQTPSAQPSDEPSESAEPSEGPSGTQTGAGVPCAGSDKWTTGSEDNTAMSSHAGLYDLRSAKHDQCDRLVFDINGPDAAGYHAEYVDVARTPGKGDPVKVKGSAVIQVGVRAWDCAHFGTKTNCPAWKVGDVLVKAPLGNVQEAKFAGVQEGQCVFAVGVDVKRPFHITTWRQGNVWHVILEVVH